jgi:hypothetical protein
VQHPVTGLHVVAKFAAQDQDEHQHDHQSHPQQPRPLPVTSGEPCPQHSAMQEPLRLPGPLGG